MKKLFSDAVFDAELSDFKFANAFLLCHAITFPPETGSPGTAHPVTNHIPNQINNLPLSEFVLPRPRCHNPLGRTPMPLQQKIEANRPNAHYHREFHRALAALKRRQTIRYRAEPKSPYTGIGAFGSKMASSDANRPNAKTIESITYVDSPALGPDPCFRHAPIRLRGNDGLALRFRARLGALQHNGHRALPGCHGDRTGPGPTRDLQLGPAIPVHVGRVHLGTAGNGSSPPLAIPPEPQGLALWGQSHQR